MKTDRETESGKPTYGPLAAETEEEWKNYTLISRTRERGRKEKKQEQRSEYKVSEDRQGDRQQRTYTEISQKRERGYRRRAKT